MEGADFPDSHQEATAAIMERIAEGLVEEEGEEKGIEDAIGFVSEPYTYRYSFREPIIYSLSVGVSTKDPQGLRFLFEDHDRFAVLPTFGVIPAMSGTDALVTGGVPGLNIDLTQVAPAPGIPPGAARRTVHAGPEAAAGRRRPHQHLQGAGRARQGQRHGGAG